MYICTQFKLISGRTFLPFHIVLPHIVHKRTNTHTHTLPQLCMFSRGSEVQRYSH